MVLILSDTTVRMSKYVRDDQKQEWYNELIYICSNCYKISGEIRDECKRRKIKHEYIPMVIEYRSRRKNNPRAQSDAMRKIEILETGLKVQQLADWAITKFNYETVELAPYDVLAYSVWIQPQREVLVSSGSYDEDGCPLACEEHWRV